jgi:hypothetical protein
MSILQATLAAMGGQNAAALQDTVVQAAATPPANTPGTSGTLTITTKGVGMIRTDGSGGGKTASTIFNNGRELRSTEKGWVTAHSSNANHKRIEHLPVLMIFQEIARGEISATYVGQETLDGRSVQHISIARVASTGNPEIDRTLTRNSQLEVFVDAQTNLVAKVSFLHIAENDWRQGLPMEQCGLVADGPVQSLRLEGAMDPARLRRGNFPAAEPPVQKRIQFRCGESRREKTLVGHCLYYRAWPL